MDSKSVFSKTAKGLREATGASSDLPRALRAILKEIDGKKTFAVLRNRFNKSSEAELKESLERLEEEGYIRNTAQLSQTATPVSSPPPAREEAGGGLDDLDFTALATQAPPVPPPSPKPAADDDALRKAQAAKQAAEAEARQEVEAKARLEAEQKAKLLALAKARQEAEEKARREAEEKAKREAEEKARQAVLARAKQDAEEKARQEVLAKARREADERARREAEERARREVVEKTRREAEEKLKRDAEERERKKAEEQARLEAEARAKREAGERARQEADDKRRREVEEQGRLEAEEKARREAEEKARRDAEEQARRDAVEKERLAAWELSKRRAEEKLRQEAEEKARREAEDRIRIEARERAEREAEARLKEALKEKARQEAEERALKEKQDRIRREAEAELLLEAKEKANREAREQAEREAVEKAAMEAGRATRAGQVKWGKLFALASVPLFAIMLGIIHLIPFNGRIPDLEKAAGEQFQQPVKIDGLHLSLFPQPHWRLDGVAVGSEGEIRAPQVNAMIDLGGLFSADMAYKSVEFKSPVLKDQAAGWLLFGKPRGQAIRIAHIRASNAAFESQNINLPRFDAKADIGADGNWQKAVLEFSNREVYVELHPDVDRVQFEINANSFVPPLGGSLLFDDFIAKGTFGRKEMTITEFLGRNSGGSLSGSASLKWAGGWSIDGTVNAKQIDTKKLAPALLTGRVDGRAAFAMRAKDARSLFAAPHMEGSFVIGQGELLGVDLMHLLQSTADSGKTGFRELGGTFVLNGGVTQIRQLRMNAGIISASGSAELNSNDMVRGRFAAAYRFDNLQAHTNIVLSGKLSAPQFRR